MNCESAVVAPIGTWIGTWLVWMNQRLQRMRNYHSNIVMVERLREDEANEWQIADNRAGNDGLRYASVEKVECLACDGKYVDDNE